jgi:hypothetical protein
MELEVIKKKLLYGSLDFEEEIKQSQEIPSEMVIRLSPTQTCISREAKG